MMPSSAAATDDTATSSTLSPVNCAICARREALRASTSLSYANTACSVALSIATTAVERVDCTAAHRMEAGDAGRTSAFTLVE